MQNNEKKSAVILLSGGLDSTVCMWWSKYQDYSNIVAITFEYGSKEEIILKEVTKKLGELAKLDEHLFIQLDFLADFSKRSGSSLAKDSNIELAKLSEEELDDKVATTLSAQSVWIPARNLIFLSIASSYAETLGGTVDIITGFNLEEGSTFPDNTQEFIDDFTKVASRGVMKAKVNIVCPLVGLNKSEIVKIGEEMKVPFEFSTSCYNPQGFDKQNRPIHCGVCESCLRRKRGFLEGLNTDPTVYEKRDK